MDINIIWKNCLDRLSKKVNPQLFTTWFKPINLASGNDTSIDLEVPNKFFLDWLIENYLQLIEEELTHITGKRYMLNWKIEGKMSQSKGKVSVNPSLNRGAVAVNTSDRNKKYGINPKYIFKNFVVGKGNEFAHAACSSVANSRPSQYNPLFIYGGVGLGKTHLLQAIGHRVLDKQANANVFYYTSESFMNEFIKFVSRDKMNQFRKKFRNADLLLIDDIQFWSGKERTQEEFFHTFNKLYESHKQIVVTCDRYPKEIKGIEERLRSRFEWGLVADIQPPDIETKVAIIKKKSTIEKINIPDDVAFFLASIKSSNIRELEGYLIRIGAVSSLTGKQINLSMAKEALKRLLPEKEKKVITMETVIKVVADFFNVKVIDLKSKRRFKNIALPRQVAMYISRNCIKVSYPEIGSYFGGKDHSTVIHACKKIESLLLNNEEMKHNIEKILNILGI